MNRPDAAYPNVKGGGLSLTRVATDASDILLWDNGTVAAGIRPLGNGQIINIGWHVTGSFATTLLGQLMDYLGVARVPGAATGTAVFRHFIANTGLHDIWVLYNDSAASVTTDLTFPTATPPSVLSELNSSTTTPVTTVGGVAGAYGLTLAPWQTRLFLSDRVDVASSSLEWLGVQRDWWAGTGTPPVKTLPTPAQEQPNSVDLTKSWAFEPVDGLTVTQIAALVLPGVDDGAWEKRDLDIWSMPDHPTVKHAVLRKTFTIPAGWSTGDIELWMWVDKEPVMFHDTGRVYIDGVLVRDFNAGGVYGLAANTLLPPGQHLIALEVQGSGVAVGVTSDAWVYHTPVPSTSQALTGTWSVSSSDGLHTTGQATLPGTFSGAYASFDVVIDASHVGSAVVLRVHRPGASVNGILINGVFVGDLYPATRMGEVLLVNITNRVNFGGSNHIELAAANIAGPTSVSGIELRYYNPTTYP